ncbi:MAG: polysaccharide deacetylase [Flaviaesturariibacter sp.]|nr:polysaccharide deacetylase [Flaviaesturariibacter sp.]
MAASPNILLSFDVEEFDLPLEYGQSISIEEQLQIGYNGLQVITDILNGPGVSTTLFTTAFFAGHFSNAIKQLSERHEIASHTFYHTRYTDDDLLQSRLELERIIGKPVTGLRMPRMKAVEAATVLEAGYIYNSSINPTWLPGRYDNRHVSRRPFLEKGLLQFPVSVTPQRIPLFWLAFKNLPYPVFRKLALQTLRKDGYLCLYFHPWEFTDLSEYKLPFYVKSGSKGNLLQKLKHLVKDFSAEGEFVGMQDFIQAQGFTK